MGYMGFKKLEGKLSGSVKDPGAVAASIGRKKYGAKAFGKAAASGTKMDDEPAEGEMPTKKKPDMQALRRSAGAKAFQFEMKRPPGGK